ncbi:lysozyme inhibitor LprI family protein [Aeromonas hydrophila]|uniref:lysozyme inhibitor LprI family protein n=2 Tax=Aeromonas TaxID=642 RepID=UPI0021E6BABD|nr:lysozyme inhibitor LprI family protein [Aeromonas hydrophila]MCV3275428.1 lysozyme inhibitor LprI family protein [Aeromonas hydrophila]
MIMLGYFFASSIAMFDARQCENLDLTAKFKCVETLYNKSDAELNKVYKNLFSYLQNDYEGIGEPRTKYLKLAQRDWIKFRDSSCNFENPQGMSSGGEGFGVEYLTCQLKKTVDRIDYLNGFLPE